MASESFQPGDRVLWSQRASGKSAGPVSATVLAVTAQRVKIEARVEDADEPVVRRVSPLSLTRAEETTPLATQSKKKPKEMEVIPSGVPGLSLLRTGPQSKPEKDPVREDRIIMEVVVDANGPEEQAMGWYYYLDNVLGRPFRARCCRERGSSPLSVGEQVKVVGMADEDECAREMFVAIQWGKRKLAVPLAQLEVIDQQVEDELLEAVADWHYWVGRGYQF